MFCRIVNLSSNDGSLGTAGGKGTMHSSSSLTMASIEQSEFHAKDVTPPAAPEEENVQM